MGSSAAFFLVLNKQEKGVVECVASLGQYVSEPFVKIIISIDSYNCLACTFFGHSVYYYCALAQCLQPGTLRII